MNYRKTMFFELTLVSFLLQLSTSWPIQNNDTSITITCEKNSDIDHGLNVICNNISITDDNEYGILVNGILVYGLPYNWISIIKITNSTVPRLYKNTFSVKKYSVTEFHIYNSGLTKIYHDDFSDQHRLEVINLTDNKITEIEENAFSNNKLLVKLILAKNKLNSIKYLTSYSQMQYLDLSYNVITKIRENDLSKNLSSNLAINLSHNLISEIEENVFPTYIDHIDLSYNYLHKLPANFDSNKIDTLLISHNKLTEIRCKNVEGVLDVSHNYIETIYDLADSLMILKYSFNNLQYISKNVFNGLSNLQHLDLSSNGIKWISTQSFSNLTDLRQLNLSHNAIRGLDISGLHFQNMVELQFLDLSYNNIDNILYGAFSGVDALKILDVSYNDLRSIDSLLTLLDLEELNISNNPLEKIEPQKIVSHLKELQKIVLNFDELACNELITYLLVFSEHNVNIEVGPAKYNVNIHGHHCNPDKDDYYVDPIVTNYKKMIYLTDYISQVNTLVVIMVICLVLLIAAKLFDIYKIAKDTETSRKIDQIDNQSSTKLLTDDEANTET